jgi:hypothetical protein
VAVWGRRAWIAFLALTAFVGYKMAPPAKEAALWWNALGETPQVVKLDVAAGGSRAEPPTRAPAEARSAARSPAEPPRPVRETPVPPPARPPERRSAGLASEAPVGAGTVRVRIPSPEPASPELAAPGSVEARGQDARPPARPGAPVADVSPVVDDARPREPVARVATTLELASCERAAPGGRTAAAGPDAARADVVQVSATGSRGRAVSLCTMLRDEAYDAYLVEGDGEDALRYKVRIRPRRDERLDALRAKLAKLGLGTSVTRD